MPYAIVVLDTTGTTYARQQPNTLKERKRTKDKERPVDFRLEEIRSEIGPDEGVVLRVTYTYIYYRRVGDVSEAQLRDDSVCTTRTHEHLRDINVYMFAH